MLLFCEILRPDKMNNRKSYSGNESLFDAGVIIPRFKSLEVEMGKKMKLQLDDLKVQSFVTSLYGDEQKKIRGASQPESCPSCVTPCTWGGPTNGCDDTADPGCQNTNYIFCPTYPAQCTE